MSKPKIIPPGSIIGIVGGGQLGRMSAVAAANLGYKTHIFTPEKNSPASHVSYKTTVASYEDQQALKAFAESVDVVSFEFENIPIISIKYLSQYNIVRPKSEILYTCQNRLREKNFINSIEVPTNRFYEVTSIDDLKIIKDKAVLKTSELGYDGKGQWIIDSKSDMQKIWNELEGRPAIIEEFVPFVKEVSVIVARDINGKVTTYPATENLHENGILRESKVPADINDIVDKKAQDAAKVIAEAFDLIGILAIEFFITKDDRALVNEMAPRPHNSGHWTMDGANTSQFEQFIRAICGLPLGSTEMHHKVTMKNLLGNEISSWANILSNPNARLHLYGKNKSLNGRKMGHINFVEAL